ncbi:hypothetical protein [Paraburkholderia sp. WSM4175]|uniref:hypothetical protein n=1 Tax=Paraburkholderia sp. WSM4175 TaxID=2991072 RepID=UPI003D209928
MPRFTAHALATNEGQAKDRALLAATLQIFCEERATEANAHLGSLVAVSALHLSAGAGEDDTRHPWPFMVSISVHYSLPTPTGSFSPMDDPSVLYLYVALGCVALFCAVLVIAVLVERRRERTSHLSGGDGRSRSDA